MMREWTSALFVAAVLLTAPAALADECDETPDCPEGQVCQKGECYVVPADCASFCEKMSPCFSGGGTVCEGVVGFDDAGEMGEVVEECHPYDGPTKDLMDDCLSDCAGAMEDIDGKAFFEILITCMKDAGYDCDAMDKCGEAAGAKNIGATVGLDDVVNISGDEDASGADAVGENPESGSSTSGGDSTSCSASGSGESSGVGLIISLCILFYVLRRRRSLTPSSCTMEQY